MKNYFIVLAFLLPLGLVAQNIAGKVTNEKKEALAGASVFWMGTEIGVTTGSNGEFELSAEGIVTQKLIASYVGHLPDTMAITGQTFVEFRLQEAKTLDDVLIEAPRDGVSISDESAIKTEQITQTELQKAACCDLAGCFETQTTVPPPMQSHLRRE